MKLRSKKVLFGYYGLSRDNRGPQGRSLISARSARNKFS
jgi:hypothetical protein